MTITDEMKRAIDLIEGTNEPLYITGKAGTGKTTLLKYIVSSVTRKRFIITAPTGVAAINAGGVTLHSFFRIPFGCLNDETELGGLPKRAIKIINSLDAIIIDEVSMVRPDVLDFIDRKLRKYRVSDQPFGGIQLIMFGDLYQLPPVVKAEEERILQTYYSGTYFFNAHAFKNTGFHVVSLNHIFRQSDPKFVNILNNIRSYKLSMEDMEDLAELKRKGASADFESDAIHICTHKKDVQKINDTLLGTSTHTFKAVIKDKFNPSAAPCDTELKLRVGARVMMLVNNREAGYCNGTICTVEDFVKEDGVEKIEVRLSDGRLIRVGTYEWEANEYKLEKDKIETVKVGSCTQYPLTLAWAITIHKSQGLTFDKIIVHSKHTFCPGQIYVALSRCTSMEGVVLDTFITPKHIHPDEDLLKFEQALEQTGGEFTVETYKMLNK